MFLIHYRILCFPISETKLKTKNFETSQNTIEFLLEHLKQVKINNVNKLL